MTNEREMTYVEIIERIMLDNEYHASLPLIYREFLKYRNPDDIDGRTPNNTLREKVQRDRKFIRIGLGVYALRDHQDKLPKSPVAKTIKEKTNRRHAEIQGMLLGIGNGKSGVENTYTPDKSPIFEDNGIGMNLGSIATITKVPLFTYNEIIAKIRNIDVIWFNERGFPHSVFEVEHSTNFRGAFTKFSDLQDFNVKFRCIAEESRRSTYERELSGAAFASIRKRCKFYSYEDVEYDYGTAKRKERIS